MFSKFILSSFILISATAILSSCGSNTKVTNVKESSVGQQLTDLDQARQQGIIDQKEYDKLRKTIIKDND